MIVTYDPYRVKAPLLRVNEEDVVGWSALIKPYTYTLTAVCLQKVKALSLNGKKLRWLLRDNPGIGYEVCESVLCCR